jgi:hypothetical protein
MTQSTKFSSDIVDEIGDKCFSYMPHFITASVGGTIGTNVSFAPIAPFLSFAVVTASVAAHLENILKSKLHNPTAIISSHNAGRICTCGDLAKGSAAQVHIRIAQA